MEWQPIETAPTDGSEIVVWCNHESDPYREPFGDSFRLTTYAAHCEAFGCLQKNGLCVAHFGGEYDDSDDGYIPAWWFSDEDCEQPVNPTHWMPLPEPPK